MENTPKNTNSPVQVSRHILESLISLAGELVLGRNQLLQGINNSDPAVIETSGQHIDLITSEIQDTIMRTRMQPVAGLFERICQTSGDRVVFDKTGKERMLDRTILDAIQNPLKALADTFIKLDAPTRMDSLNGDKILLKA